MTRRRREILAAHQAMVADGAHVSVSRLARICGLYDYRDAKRILADLRRLGAL